MTAKRIWKLFFALLVLAGLAFGGAALYKAGFTHGAMTNFSLPEGAELPPMPYVRMPYGPAFGHRVGFLGLFPLFCLGSFFFLVLFVGFGFCARRRAWNHHGPETCPDRWKQYGPPPWWGSGKPPWAEEQSQTASDSPDVEPEDPQV